jgi:hypothetical protein
MFLTTDVKLEFLILIGCLNDKVTRVDKVLLICCKV